MATMDELMDELFGSESDDVIIDRAFLLNWMEENGEDVIADGPFNFSMEQWDEFGNEFVSQLEIKHNITFSRGDDWYGDIYDDVDAATIADLYQDGEGYKMLLDSYADFINKNKIKMF